MLKRTGKWEWIFQGRIFMHVLKKKKKKNGALWQGLCLNDLPGPGKAPASRPAKGREAGYLRRVLRTASLSAPTAKWDSLIIYEGDLCVPRIRPHASWGGSSSLCLSEFGLRLGFVGLRLGFVCSCFGAFVVSLLARMCARFVSEWSGTVVNHHFFVYLRWG